MSPRLKITLAGVGVSTAFILGMLSVTGGRFVPQVADLYLIAQYAKGFAEGHPFRYAPGDPPTTGATSLLHTLFLAAGHAVGFRGEGFVAFAIFSGALFMVLAALKIREAVFTLTSRDEVADLAALMVVLNGPLAWSFHYGADIALVLALSCWLFATWVRADRPGQALAFVLPASLLAATRPEAAILVGLLGLVALFERGGEPVALSQRLRALIPALTSVAVLGVLRLLAGAASASSYSQKSLIANRGFAAAATISVEYWTDVARGLILGFYPSSTRIGLASGMAPYYAPPLMLLLAFPALLSPAPAARRALRFMQAAFVTALAVTPTIHIGIHHNRYLLFALPPLLALAVAGLAMLATRLDAWAGAPAGLSFKRLRVLALAFAFASAGRYALVYADNAAVVAQKDEATIDFINAHTPPDATFLNNATAIEYRTGRRALNITGVVTPGFTEVLPAETEAAAFEILSRAGAERLPPYLIAYENWIDENGLRVLAGGPPIFRTSSLAAPEILIVPTSGRLLGLQLKPVNPPATEGAVLVDQMNVADPADEAAHAYSFTSGLGTRSLFAALKTDVFRAKDPSSPPREMADGGRLIFGEETFEVATPGQGDLLVLMRTNARPAARVSHPGGEFRADVPMSQNRVRFTTPAGSSPWVSTPLEEGWNEVVYRIPAPLVTGGRTRITIEGRYSSYAYWIYRQPR